MVRNNPKIGTPQVSSEALDAPGDAVRLQIERDPVTIRVDGSAAYEDNGADGVVIFLLFKDDAEPVRIGIAVEEKRARVVGDGVPVGVDEDRRRGPLSENPLHYGFHGRSKDELDALFEKGDDGPYPLRHIAQTFPVIETTTQKGPQRFQIFRRSHFHQHFHLLSIRHDAGGRDGVTEEIRIRGADDSL